MNVRIALVTLATAFPALLATVAGVRVLDGSLDAMSVMGGEAYPWVTAEPVLWDRLGWMTYSVGFSAALTCTAIGCLVLAGLRWAPGGWRLGDVARRVAATVAVGATLIAGAVTFAVLRVAYGPLTALQEQLSLPQPTPQDGTAVVSIVGVGTPWSDAAAVFVPAVLCAAAAWVLLRRPAT